MLGEPLDPSALMGKSVSVFHATTGRLESLTHYDNANKAEVEYTFGYDTYNRIERYRESRGQAVDLNKQGFTAIDQRYTYDLTDQTTKAGSETFTFAANGNRNNGGYLTDRDNRLVNDPAYVYTYDAEGNRVSREALAVRNATQGGVQVVDNTPSTTGGSWTTTGAGYGGSQQVGTPTLNSRATASWQASTLPAGSYDVYATWSSIDNGLTSAPYTLTTTDGGITIQTITSAPVDFTKAPAGLGYGGANWRLIGEVNSSGTSTVTIALSTGDALFAGIAADAILFKPTGLDVARTTYEWDHQNRLTKVTNESAAFAATGAATLSPRDTTTYAYDVLGRRAAVTYDLVGPADGGGDFRRVSVYDGSQVAWTETGTNREQMVSQGTTQAMLWAPGTDQLLAIQERLGGSGLIKQPVWTLTDHLGTVKDYLAKAPTAGAESGLLLTRRYSAFGTPVAAKVWSTLPIADFTDISGKSGFFYVGQEYDASTGLQYSRARYYDPVSSEFISQDPLGFAGGDTNLYRRAGNSPANATDPSGLAWGWAAAGIGAGVSVAGYTIGTLGYSIWTGQNQVSTGGFVGAAAGGAVAGLVVGALTGDVTSVAGLVGVSALAGGAGGLASGAVGTLTDQTVQSALTGTNQYNLTAVGQNALSEGVTGLVGGAIGGAGFAAINARMFAVAFGKSAVAREAAQGVAGFAGGFVGDQTSQLSAIAVGSQNPADYSASRSLRAGAIGAGIAVGVGRAGAAWRAWASNAAKGGGVDMRWKNLPTEARKAVNDVMTEFGSGPDGAKKLLEQVRSGARPKPSTISDDTLRVYRDFVQHKSDELSKLRQDKNIKVMRDRLEIYRLWLGE